MRYLRSSLVSLLAGLLAVASLAAAKADEGMWLFNYPPRKLLKEKHDFTPTDAWLAHLQRSAVRFNNGGSGSFVSPDGLVMTNHHVGADALQKLSTKERDLMRSSFYARTHAGGAQVPRLGTERADEHRGRDRAGQRRGEGGRRLGRSGETAPGGDEHHREGVFRSDRPAERRGHALPGRAVPPLPLQEIHRRAAGLRAEEDIAFFGGDPDNFEYPRYDLDICFFRVYENGRPVKAPHYLRWNPAELKQDDLVFVAGNPGKTDRLNTVRHLEFLRDCILPASLNVLRRREVLLESFSQRSAEHARRAKDLLLMYQNARKARLGGLDGLQDPAVMNRKRAEEKALLAAAAKRAPLAAACDTAMKTVDKSLEAWALIRTDYDLLERGQAFYSELFIIARTLVRLAEETAKPNADRLREYRESNLDSLKQELFSAGPDLQRLANRPAGRLAEHVHGAQGRRTTGWCSR